MNNILIIGSGVRECSIIKKLLEDSDKLNIKINIHCMGTNNNPYINENCNIYVVDKHLISVHRVILHKFYVVSKSHIK